MPPKSSAKTSYDERKMELISKADRISYLCDDLHKLNGESLAKDYADDAPRNEMRRELEELIHGSFGLLTDSQHRAVTLVLHKLILQEGMDHANDKIKQLERDKVTDICKVARELKDECRGK